MSRPGPAACIVMLCLSPLIEDHARSEPWKCQKQGGKIILLHLLPSWQAPRTSLLFTARSTYKYLQSAVSSSENLLQALKARGICSSPQIIVRACVCFKLWRANKRELGAPGTGGISVLSCPLAWECSNHISVVHNVSKIWTRFPYFMSPSSEMSTALTALLSVTFLNLAGSKRRVSGERQTEWTGPHLFHTSVKGFQLSSVSRACFIEKRIGCCLAGLGKPFFKNFPVFFFSRLNQIWASVSPRIRELDGSLEFTSWSQTSSLTGGDGRTKCGIVWLQGGLAEPSSNSDSVQESRNAMCPWCPQLWCASQATRQSPRSPLPKDALLAQQLYKCHWERWQA